MASEIACMPPPRLISPWVVCISSGSYLCFEHVDLLDSAGVCLPNDRNDVHFLVDLLHDLHIQRFETMPRWSNEIEAGMDSSVSNLEPLHPGLSLKVGIKLVLDIVNYWSPTLGVVNSFTKPRGVDHCQRELDAILNQYSENKYIVNKMKSLKSRDKDRGKLINDES